MVANPLLERLPHMISEKKRQQIRVKNVETKPGKAAVTVHTDKTDA